MNSKRIRAGDDNYDENRNSKKIKLSRFLEDIMKMRGGDGAEEIDFLRLLDIFDEKDPDGEENNNEGNNNRKPMTVDGVVQYLANYVNREREKNKRITGPKEEVVMHPEKRKKLDEECSTSKRIKSPPKLPEAECSTSKKIKSPPKFPEAGCSTSKKIEFPVILQEAGCSTSTKIKLPLIYPEAGDEEMSEEGRLKADRLKGLWGVKKHKEEKDKKMKYMKVVLPIKGDTYRERSQFFESSDDDDDDDDDVVEEELLLKEDYLFDNNNAPEHEDLNCLFNEFKM